MFNLVCTTYSYYTIISFDRVSPPLEHKRYIYFVTKEVYISYALIKITLHVIPIHCLGGYIRN